MQDLDIPIPNSPPPRQPHRHLTFFLSPKVENFYLACLGGEFELGVSSLSGGVIPFVLVTSRCDSGVIL